MTSDCTSVTLFFRDSWYLLYLSIAFAFSSSKVGVADRGSLGRFALLGEVGSRRLGDRERDFGDGGWINA